MILFFENNSDVWNDERNQVRNGGGTAGGDATPRSLFMRWIFLKIV